MKPLCLVERKKSQLRSDPAQDIPTHGEKDHGSIEGEGQAGAPRQPDRKGERIEALQADILLLFDPVHEVRSVPELALLSCRRTDVPSKNEHADV